MTKQQLKEQLETEREANKLLEHRISELLKRNETIQDNMQSLNQQVQDLEEIRTRLINERDTLQFKADTMSALFASIQAQAHAVAHLMTITAVTKP